MTRSFAFALPLALLFLGAAGAEEPKPPTVQEETKAESLFAKLRGSERAKDSPVWKEFLAQPAAAVVARKHLAFAAEPDRGRAAAIAAVAALEGANGKTTADDCARFALEDKSPLVRAVAKETLAALDVPTPKRVLHALKAKGGLPWRALDIIHDHPDEAGLFGIIVAAEFSGVGGGGPRGYILNATQYAYIRDITAVVQVAAVAYDPEIGYVETGSVLDTRVISISEYMTVFYDITGKSFKSLQEAKAWWEANKNEVLKKIQARGTK